MPDDDAMADMYLLVDSLCEAKGMSWYELSNWSKPGHECKHNVAYWHNANWWGLGPGAHSHMNGKRFWNVKHPSAYKTRVFSGETPIHESEVLTAEQIQDEKIMLSIRMREGISFTELAPHHLERLAIYKENGYVSLHGDSVTLTPVGRLIADRIVRELVM
jgi:oxygen-independent coproporphyrinogen-3 oxidase